MASIKVSNLDAAGLSLFNDQESYLNDIKEADLTVVNGGASPAVSLAPASSVACATAAAAAGGALIGGLEVLYNWLVK